MKNTVDISKVFSLGHFETRGVSPDEMFKIINRNQKRTGYWLANIICSRQIKVTSGLKFSLVIVDGRIASDRRLQLNNIVNTACELHLKKPTFEMGYYLWEFMCSLRTQDRKINGFDKLVICHEPINLGNTCPRIMSVDNSLVVCGEIGGPGHCFDEKTGFVFQSPMSG